MTSHYFFALTFDLAFFRDLAMTSPTKSWPHAVTFDLAFFRDLAMTSPAKSWPHTPLPGPQELGDKTRFISAVRRRASTEDMNTHSEKHEISFPVVFWSVFRLFVSCLFEYELYRSVIVSLFLSLYVSLYVCASFMRGWGWAYLFRSLKVERSDITQPILCTERQMENPRFILAVSSSPTHMVNNEQQVLKGPSIFKLPSW